MARSKPRLGAVTELVYLYLGITLAIEVYHVHDVWSHPKSRGNVGYHYLPGVLVALIWPVVLALELLGSLRRTK
jgi:hypothetical protein